jgi:hypothetical protein
MPRILIMIGLGGALAVVAAGSASSLTVGGVDVNVGGTDVNVPTTTLPAPSLDDPTAPITGGGSIGDDLTGGGSTGGDSTGGDSTGSGSTGGESTSGSTTSDSSTTTSSGGTSTSKNRAGLFDKARKKRRAKRERQKVQQPPLRNPDGSPTPTNPGLTVAQFGPAPIGVPNLVIDSFEIPPFLLPIYQSCGTEYGIPWQVLASINKIETAFGTNLNVSSAGAQGWMQFIPSTWVAYGVDANDDKRKDPYNPVDAICAAARYLRAAGGDKDIRTAIFAYNHADWYVDEVMFGANQYGRLPDALVGSLTGLTEGAHFPVAADSRYADDIDDAAALKDTKIARTTPGNAAEVIRSNASRRSINIYSSVNAPVVAVNDGVIKKMGASEKLGKYLVLQDAYGNQYTYSHLGSISRLHAVPREQKPSDKDLRLKSPKKDAAPTAPATAGDTSANRKGHGSKARSTKSSQGPANTEEGHDRLYALPQRPNNVDRASASGQIDQLLGRWGPDYETFRPANSDAPQFDPKTMRLKPLKKGSHVIGGSVLGRIGRAPGGTPYLNFAIRPAGRGAPAIDPKPILDGWKLLETTAIYRAADKDPFASDPTVGQVLLESKAALQQRVLADPKLSIYTCGREDIQTGQIDRRILAVLEYLVAKGYRLTITSLQCGHSYLTSSGNVSAHSYGSAVDIAAVDNIPILGHQGPGSITEAVIRDLMLLQGTMRPAQIISLMELGPPTFSLGDHDDHIHVGYTFSTTGGLKQLGEILKPEQWQRLIERLGEIPNPNVPGKPSDASLPANKRGSANHQGE